jgi:hypothetical protein
MRRGITSAAVGLVTAMPSAASNPEPGVGRVLADERSARGVSQFPGGEDRESCRTRRHHARAGTCRARGARGGPLPSPPAAPPRRNSTARLRSRSCARVSRPATSSFRSDEWTRRSTDTGPRAPRAWCRASSNDCRPATRSGGGGPCRPRPTICFAQPVDPACLPRRSLLPRVALPHVQDGQDAEQQRADSEYQIEPPSKPLSRASAVPRADGAGVVLLTAIDAAAWKGRSQCCTARRALE